MKPPILLLLLLCFTTNAFCQNKTQTEPFIVQGKLTHFAGKQIILFFRDVKKGYKDYTIDTVLVDTAGIFYLKTKKITQPVLATLRGEMVNITMYAAPGYSLTVTADVPDFATMVATKNIAGKGAACNQYLVKLDSLQFANKEANNWYDLNAADLVRFVKKDSAMRDSLYHAVFYQKTPPDQWHLRFAKMTQLDTKFIDAYYLLEHAIIDTTFNYQQSINYINNNVSKALIAGLYNSENLLSENYTSWLMGTYADYLRKLMCRKTPDSCKEDKATTQLLDIENVTYKGQIREIKMFRIMQSAFTYCRTFEELNNYKKTLPPYIALLKNKADRDEMDSLIATTELTLAITQTGNPAPSFTSKDSSGKVYNLGDFKGKVVLLDLWASWCGPCRYETPFIQKLADKYKSEPNMVFMSVAVNDKLVDWQEALHKDKPTWLQLFDADGSVSNSYVARSIPKFVLINKKGNIVSFDAPMPSNTEALVKMLDKEIAE